MNNNKIHFFSICIMLLIKFSLQNYTTTENRTQIRQFACSKTRAQMLNISYHGDYDSNNWLTSRELELNGELMFKHIVNGQNGEAWKTVKGDAQLWTYSIFFALGLLFLVGFVAPFAICWCINPQEYPTCKSLRYTKYNDFSKCQRSFSNYIMIIISSLLAFFLPSAIKQTSDLQNFYNDTQCSFAVLFDDTLNGNVTLDQNSFFVGLSTLKTGMQALQSSIYLIQSQVQPAMSSSSTIQTIFNKISNSKSELPNIPNGAGGDLVLNYGSPIESSTPATTIPSSFPGVLGNTSTPTSLIGSAYLSLIELENKIKLISQAADDFYTTASSQDSFLTAISTIDTYINQVNRINQEFYDQTERVQTDYINKVGTAVKAIFICSFIFFGLLLITFMAILKQKFYLRRIFYILGGVMVVMGVLLFLCAILFSATTFLTYYGCKYLKTGISSPQKFEEYFGPIMNDQKTTNIMKMCIASGPGNIIQQIVDSQTLHLITSIGTLSTLLQDFTQPSTINNFKKNYISLSQTIQKYQTARILDIDSNSDLAALSKVSNAQNYACTQIGFNEDSWIPSVNQNYPPYIACNIANSALVTNTSCANFNSRSPGCVGCIDTYGVFQDNSTRANVLAALSGRYASADCAIFNTELSNIWNNFYRIKKEQIGPVLARSNAVTTNLNDITNELNTNTVPTFEIIFENMLTIDSAMTDPKYGVVAGLNCHVLSQDLQLLERVVCGQVFVISYNLRFRCIIVSFAIIVLTSQISCLGRRNLLYEEYRKDNPECTGMQINQYKENKQQVDEFKQFLGTITQFITFAQQWSK